METGGRATSVASGDEALGGALNRALHRPLLSSAEEWRLARRFAEGDRSARDRLIEGNVRLVVAIARMHRGRGVPHADLVQEGMTGLLCAIERFDPDRGNRLATYAIWWIRRAMLRAIATAPPIRLPAEGQRELAAILRAEQELTTYGRPRPTSSALAMRTGLAVQRVERLRAAPQVVTSLDAQMAGGESTFADVIADPLAPEVASAMETEETRRDIIFALRLLAPRVRRVLQLRFGLDGGNPVTYDSIGEQLGITAERARQIEAGGLRRLLALAERASMSA
jgi:RNA polymerase nonessential primary-like sigma factor